MYPNGFTRSTFKGSGIFGDISLSMSSTEMLNIANVHVGDGLFINFSTGAGTCWSNVRMISQNWFPMYMSGTQSWESSVWSNTSGSGYSNAWVTGKDAVFEGTGGTVTVSTAVSANSLNFANDATGTGYTIQGSGTISLTATPRSPRGPVRTA